MAHDLAGGQLEVRVLGDGGVPGGILGEGRATLGEGLVDIGEDADGLVGAEDEAGAEEGDEEDDAVVELDFGAREVELVAEPVDVEEGGGELVEDEDGGVGVDEGALGVVLARCDVFRCG